MPTLMSDKSAVENNGTYTSHLADKLPPLQQNNDLVQKHSSNIHVKQEFDELTHGIRHPMSVPPELTHNHLPTPGNINDNGMGNPTTPWYACGGHM